MRTLVLFFGFVVCNLLSTLAFAVAPVPQTIPATQTSFGAVLPKGGIVLRQFTLVTPKDVYGRHSQRLFALEGKAGLGTLFRADIEAISGKLP